MAYNLCKCVPVRLTDINPNLKKLLISLNHNGSDEGLLELGLAVIIADDYGRALSNEHMIYLDVHKNSLIRSGVSIYSQKLDSDSHSVDMVEIDLCSFEQGVGKILLVGYIRCENTIGLSGFSNVHLNLSDLETNHEFGRSLIDECHPGDTAIILAEMFKGGDDQWNFSVLNQGFANGLKGIVKAVGLDYR